MASAKRILVLGTSVGGGDWPPLAAVTVGLHQAGHAVQCFGDPSIAQEFTAAGIAIEVVPAKDPLAPFTAWWQGTGVQGLSRGRGGRKPACPLSVPSSEISGPKSY